MTDSEPINSRIIEKIEPTILDRVNQGGVGKTICPSEVSRQIDPEDWRLLMPHVRQVAAELAVWGSVVVTRGGKLVDPLNAGGPIRIGLPTV